MLEGKTRVTTHALWPINTAAQRSHSMSLLQVSTMIFLWQFIVNACIIVVVVIFLLFLSFRRGCELSPGIPPPTVKSIAVNASFEQRYVNAWKENNMTVDGSINQEEQDTVFIDVAALVCLGVDRIMPVKIRTMTRGYRCKWNDIKQV